MEYALDLLKFRFIEKPGKYSPLEIQIQNNNYLNFLNTILSNSVMHLTSLYYTNEGKVKKYKSTMDVHRVGHNFYNIPIIIGEPIGKTPFNFVRQDDKLYSTALDENSRVYIETDKNIDPIIDKYMEEMIIRSKKEKEIKLKYKSIDPFSEEDWELEEDPSIYEKTIFKPGEFFKKVFESTNDRINGTIEISNYATTWECIFKTRYRNLTNGDVKDIKKLLVGPIAVIINGELKMFNGNDKCVYDFIHTRRMEYVEIWQTKEDKEQYEYHRKKIKQEKSTNRLKEIYITNTYYNKMIRFSLNDRLMLLDIVKYEDDIMELAKIPDCVMFLTDVYGNIIKYKANILDSIEFEIDNTCAVFESKIDKDVYVDILKPITYDNKVPTTKNKELDPFDEDDWD